MDIERDVLQGVGARKATGLISVVPFHRYHAPPCCIHRMGTAFFDQLKTAETHYRGKDRIHTHIYVYVCVCVEVWLGIYSSMLFMLISFNILDELTYT